MHPLPARGGKKIRRTQPPTIAAAADVRRAIAAAWRRIRVNLRETPIERSAELSKLARADVWLKHEEQQVTGSFKLRGALNAVLALRPSERRHGIVAASTGNHGLALTHALKIAGARGTIVVPTTIAAGKRAALIAAGAPLRFVGRDSVEAEHAARALARRRGVPYVSPYNHADVIAGQGTLGLEIDRQMGPTRVDAVFIAVGGGGLIAGMAAWLKHARPGIRIIGCQPARSAVMAASIAAGSIVDLPYRATLSDATAGGIEAGALTVPLCRDLVDEWIEVDERAIAAAMRTLFDSEHCVVEGSAALTLAALLQEKDRFRGQRVVLTLCGRNIDRATLRRVLSSHRT